MNQDEINTLTLTTYYILRSKKTGRIYIDEENTAHLYEVQKDANEYIEKTDDSLYFDKPESVRALFLCTEIYDQGGDRIYVKKANKSGIYIEVTGDYKNKEVKKQFYNHELNGSINKLRQTLKKKYLREMKDMNLIIPIKIDPRMPKQQQRIHYAYTKLSEKEEMYFAFSTLKEFNDWNKSQNEQFSPYEMRIGLFIIKHEDKGIIINPETDNLVLTQQLIGVIKEEKQS